MTCTSRILFAAAAVAIAGCEVKSLVPLYGPADVVFEPSLAGTWITPDNGRLVLESLGNAYRAELREADASPEDLGTWRLVRVGDDFFFDAEDTRDGTHTYRRVGCVGGTMMLCCFSDGWLRGHAERHPGRVTIKTIRSETLHEEGRVVSDEAVYLAGTTEQARRLVAESADNPLAFGLVVPLRREGPTPGGELLKPEQQSRELARQARLAVLGVAGDTDSLNERAAFLDALPRACVDPVASRYADRASAALRALARSPIASRLTPDELTRFEQTPPEEWPARLTELVADDEVAVTALRRWADSMPAGDSTPTPAR